MEKEALSGKKADLIKFFGILSKESGDRLKRNIEKIRKIDSIMDRERMERVAKAMSGEIDSSEIYEISQKARNKVKKLMAKNL